MIKSERELWHHLRRGLGEYNVVLQRIETGATSQGVFDVNALFNGVEAWIELKYMRGALSPEQKAWCVRRLQAGGITWVISTSNDVLELWNGREAVIHGFYPERPSHIFPYPTRFDTLTGMLFYRKVVKNSA